ncbi:hypothetical protein SUDANB121_02949 [Nocardiopsis dassonvillei]|uniref:hypothetical protein n=1 Tax=Nocardiopsis dassonvillei TaxID=2014 RepID=UPI003F55B12D
MASSEEDGIHSAFAVVAFFQNNIGQADTKIGFLCVAQIGFSLALINTGPPLGAGPLPGWLPLLACCVAFVLSGYHLVSALRPRTLFGRGRMVMGLTDFSPGRPLSTDEVWGMVSVLVRVSREKNHHIQRCLPWLSLMLFLIVLNGAVSQVVG